MSLLGSIVESMMNTSNTEGQCISRAPYFDGTNNYSDWKERMILFIQSVDFKLWLVLKNGPKIPTKIVAGREIEKSEDEFGDEDIKNMQLEAKAKYILCCAMNPDAFKQISEDSKTAKEIWDKLDRGMSVNVNSVTPQPQGSVRTGHYNSPDYHFLEETREAMNKFIKWCVPLHKHALEGNWPAAKRILDEEGTLKHAAIAKGHSTLLHVAAGANQASFVKELLPLLSDDHVGLQDMKGNTAFSFAAAVGNFDIVNSLQSRNPQLANIRSNNGFAPVHFAALQGKCEMACHLFDINYSNNHFSNLEDWELLFLTCISNGNYHLALKMARMKPEELAFARDKNNYYTALHLLAQIKKPLDSFCHCPKEQDPIMINPCSEQHVVFQLVKFLWTTILQHKHLKNEIQEIINEPFQLLFHATEVGNFGFLSELISYYPDLIWEVDGQYRSIIHKAVLHRQAGIYNLLHEIPGAKQDVIVTYILKDDSTLLHLAAKLAPQTQLQLISGAAFQMCQELVWFEEVKKIMRPSFIKLRNSQGLTAQELFTKEHEELRGKAETWMKDTAGSCMLISTVIATGVLAGAINIPGGVNDDEKGKPNYLSKSSFMVFVISDVTAFVSSATAILIFLSILISRYAGYDFYLSLPVKLISGLIMLFISITSMMVAFSSSFFIAYYYGSMQTPCLISAFASLPIILFLSLHYSLLLDVIHSTFLYRGLFRSKKKLIYVLDSLEN